MARNRNKRRTTEELVAELREFHHDEAAYRLEAFARYLTANDLCEYCGRKPGGPGACQRKEIERMIRGD